MDKIDRPPFLHHFIDEETTKILMDKELIEKAYATRGIANAAAVLGINEYQMRMALKYYQIKTRVRGEHIVSKAVLDSLEDRELVAKVYATHNIKQSAKILGVSVYRFREALIRHQIKIRNKGQTASPLRLAKGQVELAVLRAYLRVGKCPISCPGRNTCLNEKRCALYDAINKLEKVYA